jgi:DNA helicase-2/ATP-dependent DNA helicase PcrA
MKSVFKERYERLNPRQKEAVDTIEGPVMVIAGPGTGKTTILTLRIANILDKTDTPASGILAITFTDAGVKAMRMKLREVIGPKADEVRIHTFHGFAASIIHEFPEHFAHISRSKQITDIESEALVRDILKEKRFTKLRPFGNPDLYVGPILRTISDSKKEAWSPAMLQSFADGEIERIKNDEDSLSTRGETKGKLKAEAQKRIDKCEKTILFADVYNLYEDRKKKEKYIDFDDLIIELLLALEKDELLLRIIQEKFLYILVDEHQDTNDSQNLLIRAIANFFDNPNLFVVGDEKQAVYRFQGASVENFLTFQNIWKSMKMISLSHNYRSHQGILDAGFSLIENNYSEGEHENLRIELVSGAKSKEKPIEVVTSGNTAASMRHLATKVREMTDEDSDATVAVITRTNRDVERILSYFEKEGIDASAERGVDIFSHPLGSIFFDLIEFLADHSKTELLARTLAVGLWNLDFGTSSQLIRNIRGNMINNLEKSIPQLKYLQTLMTKAGSVEFLIDAASQSGFLDKAIRDPLSSEVWRGIVSLAQDIGRRDMIIDPKKLIDALISYRTSAESKTIKITSGKTEARVSIMTAHSSKGLEYDFVFIPFANEESWMPRARSSFFILPKERAEGDEVRDARRLFYVALTRAREHLTILCELSDGLGKDLTPLRFISEIDQKKIKKVDLEPYMEKPAQPKKREDKDRTDLIEYAKNSLIERGLSVTALNHFSCCPNLFFYKSILRVPEPPTASSEKGNAMHEAMSRVWKLEKKTEKKIAETIVESVYEYFSKSLLSSFEKEPLLEELIEDAAVVAKALMNHFAITGNARTETLELSNLKMEIDGKEYEFKLHGRLDAIIETEEKIYVFDYKTREAMSVAAIRGETKNADGGYFRQLIFYKKLLSQNPKYKEKIIEPALVFIKPDDKGRCPVITIPITDADIKRVELEAVNLFKEVWKGNILSTTCGDPDCDGCKLKKASQI